jgi:hypothetical protein
VAVVTFEEVWPGPPASWSAALRPTSVSPPPSQPEVSVLALPVAVGGPSAVFGLPVRREDRLTGKDPWQEEGKG